MLPSLLSRLRAFVYIYREIKVEAHKEEYPLKLLQLMDYSMKQFDKHPWMKRAFERYTKRNKAIGAVVKERYERYENSGKSEVTDHTKVKNNKANPPGTCVRGGFEYEEANTESLFYGEKSVRPFS